MIQMDKNEKSPDENMKKNQGIDPVQLIIWGILLVAYGVYSTYKTANAGIETNLIFILMPNLIMTVFGILMILVGYRKENERKEKKN